MKSQILSVLNECDFDVIGDAIHVKHNGQKIGELTKDPTFSGDSLTAKACSGCGKVHLGACANSSGSK